MSDAAPREGKFGLIQRSDLPLFRDPKLELGLSAFLVEAHLSSKALNEFKDHDETDPLSLRSIAEATGIRQQTCKKARAALRKAHRVSYDECRGGRGCAIVYRMPKIAWPYAEVRPWMMPELWAINSLDVAQVVGIVAGWHSDHGCFPSDDALKKMLGIRDRTRVNRAIAQAKHVCLLAVLKKNRRGRLIRFLEILDPTPSHPAAAETGSRESIKRGPAAAETGSRESLEVTSRGDHLRLPAAGGASIEAPGPSFERAFAGGSPGVTDDGRRTATGRAVIPSPLAEEPPEETFKVRQKRILAEIHDYKAAQRGTPKA